MRGALTLALPGENRVDQRMPLKPRHGLRFSLPNKLTAENHLETGETRPLQWRR